jgi:hypothetical protein
MLNASVIAPAQARHPRSLDVEPQRKVDRGFPVVLRGGLVTDNPGLRASVKDADEAVPEPAEHVAVLKFFGTLLNRVGRMADPLTLTRSTA